MADENNDALLQEINELIEQLKTFPENREEATDEQKQQITEIYSKMYNKKLSLIKDNLNDEQKNTFNKTFQTYSEEAKTAFNALSPLKKMEYLPSEQDKINDSHKHMAGSLFKEIFEQVAADHKLSPEEKSILATYMPVFGAEAQSVLATMQNQADILAKLNAQAPVNDTPQPMSEEDKSKVDAALKTLHSALYNRDGNPTNFGSNDKAKKAINSALRTFSTNLDGVQGEFTAEQITELQSALQPFRDNKKLNISIDKLLSDTNKKGGNKYTPTPAFTQLYSQLNPNYQAEQEEQIRTNELNQRLRGVFTQLTAPENETVTDDQEIIIDDIVNTDEGAEDTGGDNTPDNPDNTNDDEHDDASVPPAPTEEQIDQYLKEIRDSNSPEGYLSDITPKISEASIITSMALEEVKNEETNEVTYTAVQARALALSNPDDLLVAYNYYKEKNPEKLADVEAVIAESLRNADHANLNPENAFVWLTLADKIKDNEDYKGTYEAFTTGLAMQLQKYDQETYKGLDAETLAANYEAAKQGLEGLDPEFMQSLIADYTFTDDNGKPLTDKNRGRIMGAIRGKGNDRSDTLDGLFETARLMAAQELAAEGLPQDPALRKQVLESKMREQMAQILSLKVDSAIIAGAQLVAETQTNAAKEALKKAEDLLKTNEENIKKHFEDEKAKIEASKKSKKEKAEEIKKLEEKKTADLALAKKQFENVKTACNNVINNQTQIQQKTQQQILAGDENTLRQVAVLHALKEMGLPLDKAPDFSKDEAKQRAFLLAQDKYLTALKDGQRKSTAFTKSELGARLGGVMTKVHKFQARNSQHFKGTKLDTKSNSWWRKIDQKLTKTFGAPYIEGKKWTKKIGKIAWNVGKGIAIASTVSAVAGPLGMAALTGYYAVKQWKNVSKQLKDKEASGWKKAALVVGAVATTTLSAATAMAGIGGIESLSNALGNPAILQSCANFTSSLGIAGRAAINAAAVTLPNWVERQVIRNKRKKLDKLIAGEKDPVKLAKLIEDHKKLEVKRIQNNQELFTKGLAVGVGLGIGGTINAYGSEIAGGVKNMFTSNGTEASAAMPNSSPTTEPIVAAAPSDSLAVEPNAAQALQAGMGGGFFTNANGILQPGNFFESLNFGEGITAADSTGTEHLGPVGLHHITEAEAAQVGPLTQDGSFLSAEAQAAQAAQVGPLTQDGSFLSAEAQAQQQAEANLNEAHEAGTGWRGQSSYDSAHNNLNDYKGSLGMNDQQVDAATQKMCEVYGDDAYKATHAALAEPAHLASAMGLSNADLGLEPGQTLTSAHMLNYLQTHDMSGNEGFNSYMETHFHTDQQLFTPSERPAHINTSSPVVHQQPVVQHNTGNENTAPIEPSTISYEVVNQLPGQQPHHQQPTEIIYTQQTNVTTNHPPVYQTMGYGHGYERVPVYGDILEGKPNANGNFTVDIVRDPRTGQFYEMQVSPAGTVQYNPRTEQNIIEECRAEMNHPSMHTRYTYGTGVVTQTPYMTSVDKAIEIGNLAATGGHVFTGALESFGVIGHRDASNIHTGLGAAQDLSRIGQAMYHMSKVRT